MTHDLPESAREREALELLPWYVNGTLGGAEREDVRRALRSSLTCRLEHDRLVRLQGLMRQDDAELAATDRGFERLMSRIHRRRLWQGPALLQAAAVMLAVFGLALWWGGTGPARQPFETLTAPEPASLRVVFAPEVAADARRELLAAHGLAITAPPTAEGVYTLALPAGANGRAIADALRADPRVVFASMPPANETR
jgi:hypothetical protein